MIALCATCPHLRPVEMAMRDAGLWVEMVRAGEVSSRCVVVLQRLWSVFAVPKSVSYVEPLPGGEGSYFDLHEAMLYCQTCHSTIWLVHPAQASPDTPKFPESPSA